MSLVNIPSGKLTVCYWEWPSRHSWFTHEKWWFSIVFCESLPEGIIFGMVTSPVFAQHMLSHSDSSCFNSSFFPSNMGNMLQAAEYPFLRPGSPFNRDTIKSSSDVRLSFKNIPKQHFNSDMSLGMLWNVLERFRNVFERLACPSCHGWHAN